MSEALNLPWVSLSVALLAAASVWSWRQQSSEGARRGATVALGLALVGLAAAGIEATIAEVSLHEPLPAAARWVLIDPLNALALPLYAGLALGLLVLAPRRKVTPRWISGILLLTAATLSAYAANNLAVFALGWAVSLVPFLEGRFFAIAGVNAMPRLARWILTGSAAMVTAGVALIALETPGSLATRLGLAVPRTGLSPMLFCAFGLLMVAVFLRKGLVPAHTWVVPSFERGPLIPLTLLFNGHLGAFLIARVALPTLPDVSAQALPLLGDLGLITACYTAVLALAETNPRKLLALLAISQSSFLVVGLESTNPDAIAGALVHWQVVVVASSMLTAVCAAIEARLGATPDGKSHLGLASSAPRLAVFFAAGGLALVGLPLTLGFCAEDLLLHGTLETHPQLGIILPIVTALNAFTVIRLFTRLFLGKPAAVASDLRDALPRERLVLTAALLFLIIGGLRPSYFVHLPARAAERLVGRQTARPAEAARTLSEVGSAIPR